MTYSIIAQLKFKKPTDDVGTITIRGFIGRKPAGAKSTGHKCTRENWDHARREVKPNAPNPQLINLLISKKIQGIQATLLQKELMGAVISKQHVKQAVDGLQHSRLFIEYCKAKIESDYKNDDTKRGLIVQCDKIEEFHPGVCFYDINSNWLARYKKYLSETRENNHNTIWNSMKFINTMINKAIKEGGIVASNPFSEFDRGTWTYSNRKPLTIEECNSIYELISKEDVIEKIRAVACRFMLMVYSGMRFTDAMRFDPDKDLQNGRFVMSYKKWDEKVNFVLYNKFSEVAALIKKYPLSVSNVDFNRWLKIIGEMCKINKPISAHIGRHTLGFLLSEMNIPKEKASKILGHKNLRSTDIYYHVTDDQVDREISKLNVL